MQIKNAVYGVVCHNTQKKKIWVLIVLFKDTVCVIILIVKGNFMEEKTDVIIVTDPGVDDAITLMYAIFCEKFNIKLLAIAGGNGPISNATNNALFLMELFKQNIPVAVGPDHPLKRPPVYATKAQGKGGLGGITVNPKKLKTKPLDIPACDAIYNTLKKGGKKITVVAIGPMTPLAEMLEKYSDSKKYIKQIIFMGGTKEKILGKPYREFNISFDPESVEIVIKSKIPLVMVPMELGHFAYLDKNDIKRFKKTNKIGKLYAKMFKKYKDFHVGHLGAAVHDVCTMYYLTNPQNIKTEDTYIEMKNYKDDTAEFGYIDTSYTRKPNAKVCVDMNISDFKYDLFQALENTKKIL